MYDGAEPVTSTTLCRGSCTGSVNTTKHPLAASDLARRLATVYGGGVVRMLRGEDAGGD